MKITVGIAISMVCINITPTAGVGFQFIPFGTLAPNRGARAVVGSSGNVYTERIGRRRIACRHRIERHRITIGIAALIVAVCRVDRFTSKGRNEVNFVAFRQSILGNNSAILSL